MKEIILSKTSIFEDELPAISKVNNNIIKNNILETIIKNINYVGDQRFNDIQINFDQNINWVTQYICDNMFARHSLKLVPLNFFVKVHEKNEGSIKRNYIDFYDFRNSPDFTSFYFIDSDENDLIIEYEDYRPKYYNINFKTNKIIVWNSSLNHYVLPNKNNFRYILGINFKKI